MTKKNQRIVIKLGTNAISNGDGTLNEPLLKDIVGQIVKAKNDTEVLMISSGAVGSGKTLIPPLKYDDVTNKQIYATVGQVRLMNLYSNLFGEYNQRIAQILATKADFTNREHFLNMKNCLESIFKENITPIMNENDFVAIEELMFTDNDELAGLISEMLCANILIIMTNVDGVYDQKGGVIKQIEGDSEIPEHILNNTNKSSFGKGGILTKFKMAQHAAKKGTDVFIVNSKEPNMILRILDNEHLGTHFIASK